MSDGHRVVVPVNLEDDAELQHLQTALLGEHGANGIVQEARGSWQPEGEMRWTSIQDDVVEKVGVHVQVFEAHLDEGYATRQPPDPQDDHRTLEVAQRPPSSALGLIQHSRLPTCVPAHWVVLVPGAFEGCERKEIWERTDVVFNVCSLQRMASPCMIGEDGLRWRSTQHREKE